MHLSYALYYLAHQHQQLGIERSESLSQGCDEGQRIIIRCSCEAGYGEPSLSMESGPPWDQHFSSFSSLKDYVRYNFSILLLQNMKIRG